MKFIFQSEAMDEIYSPSSDKNTFLVVHFTQEKSFFYEFKLVRNEADK